MAGTEAVSSCGMRGCPAVGRYVRKEPTMDAVLLVGSGETTLDIEYVTGFRAVDPVVCLCSEKKRWLVVPEMEFGRAETAGATRSVEVLTPARLGIRRNMQRRLSAWAGAVMKKAGVRTAVVPGWFPLGVARKLERSGLRLRIAQQDLFPGRAVKSQEEIRHITASQQAAVIAMRAAIRLIADAEIDGNAWLQQRGRRLTSEIVREHIMKVLLEHGCMGRDVIVAGGRQAADPHCMGEGPLRAHESIVIDIFPRHLVSGYWGDLTRTVVRGKASPELRRIYQAVRAAQTHALRTMRPGKSLTAPHRAAVETFASLGLVTNREAARPTGFIHGTGHGVGLAIHEAPSLGAVAGKLRAGHVVTVEPGWYDPDIGGVRIEDTVVMTRHGWRYLAPCEKRFEV